MRRIACLATILLGLVLSLQSFGQTAGTVSGTVLADDDGTPLLGVTVTNTKTNKKANTNTVGFYSIAANSGDVLVFTFVGYANKEMTVGAERIVNVRMVASDKDLGNVVVTAYGIQRARRELTYQAITVQGDEIAATRRDNFINSLAGRVPGAMITSTSGMPGSSTSIILRGPTSIDGSNQPIFVVDGLIIDNGAFETKDRFSAPSGGLANYENTTNDFRNRAADINPEDIENITILKGPEATALYGSDGANGAIIITTKKGKKGKASVSYNNSFRWEKVYRLPEIYTEYDQGSLGVTSPTRTVRTYFGQKIPDGVPRFDNLNSFFRTGKAQTHNVSVEGGGDLSTYRFTASVFNQEGTVPNTGFKRYNFRLNTNFQISPKINISNSITYIQSHTDKGSKGPGGFLISLLTWPTVNDITKFVDANGNRAPIRGDLNGAETDNPFWDVNRNPNFDDNNRLQGNIQVSYNPTKWLNLTALTGLDYYNTSGTIFYHPQSNVARTIGGLINQFRETQMLVNGAYRATFKQKFGDVLNTLTAAFTFDTRKLDVTTVKGERLFDPTFVSINNAEPITVGSLNSAENFNRFGAFLTYSGSYKNWLNFSLSGRMDGSSKLIDPLNYNIKDALYYYWSAGTSVVFTDLFKNLPSAITYGKARLNYATTGRDPRAAYVKGNKFSTSNFTGGGFITGTAQGGFFQGNPDLRPEFSQQMETGIELKFFKRRLGFDFAYYDNRTKDQLLPLRLSYVSGAILKWVNGGTTQNKGFEFQLTGTPIQKTNFNWDVTVNFSRNRNKILEMPVGIPFFYNSDTWQVGDIRGQMVEGGTIYQLAGANYVRNVNGDLVISATTGLPLSNSLTNNPIIIGDRQPDFNIGLINSFNVLKDWNLSFNLDIRKGGDVYNGTEEALYRVGLSPRTADRETPRVVKGVLNDGLQNTNNPTPNNIVITPLFRSDYYSSVISSDFVEKDVNWIRMRDLTLSYNLSKNLLKRQRLIKSASVFVTGTDLFIITNYSGADPSANANNTSARAGVGGVGMDYGTLATPRGINVGMRIQL
jgi:ferric enterobactin receptor